MHRCLALGILVSLLLGGCALSPRGCPARLVTIATGLTHPRGFVEADDGTLFVAEAGNDVLGGRVSRVTPDGKVARLAAGLPHSVNAGVEDVGASGVALRHGEPWVAHGEASGDLASTLWRLRQGQPPEKMADLAAFEQRFNPDDDQVESNPYAVVYDESSDHFYVTDAAANTLLRVSPLGQVQLVAVWREGWVPTGVARGPDGALYVALFGRFPHPPSQGRVDRVDPTTGATSVVAGDLTMPVGIAVSPAGAIHVVEFAARLDTAPRLAFRPDSGRLVRLAGGRREVVLDRLPFPTGLVHGRDGRLLIALRGAMSGAESGTIARVEPCR